VSWAIWLLVPVAVTVLAALASWLRHRPARPLDMRRAMRAHDEFLDALAQTPRSKDTRSKDTRSKEKGITGD
jgi:hypothetical protein